MEPTPRPANLRLPGLLRHGAAVALADQVVYSGANFMLAAFVGRFGTKADLGLYAFLILLVLGAGDLHRAAIWIPMNLMKDPGYLRPTRRLSLAYGLLCAGAMLVMTGVQWRTEGRWTPTTTAHLLLVPAMVLTAVHEINRRVIFYLDCNWRVLLADLAYLGTASAVLLAGALLLRPQLHERSLEISLTALSSGAAAGWVVSSLGLRHLPKQGHRVWDVLRRYWPIGLSFVGSTLLVLIARQGALMVVMALAGKVALAGVEAARQVSSPLQVLVMGIASFTVPGVARAFLQRGPVGMTRFIRHWGALLTAFGAAYALLVSPLAPPVCHILLRKEFDHLGVMTAIYCLLAVGNGLNSLVVIELGLVGYPRGVLWARLPGTLALALGIVPLVYYFGALGAMAGMAVETVLSLSLAYHIAKRRRAGGMTNVGVASAVATVHGVAFASPLVVQTAVSTSDRTGKGIP